MDKVISSSIKRSFNKKNDELYELLKVIPTEPIIEEPVEPNICDFQPRKDKQYIPKKKIKHKVKTVRDIRNDYEKTVLSLLPAELEKQQNYILRKIKSGFIRDENMKNMAKKILNCDKPLTKSTWQMLMNINPENRTHSTQYVLWNGKPIRVNGSRGGKSKFICKYDLGRSKSLFKFSGSRRNFSKQRKGSLLNSLSINFKPGPLTRKKYLDDSYQKHHIGSIELINLPKPGLEIQPLYGNALDPTIATFVNKLRDENGSITKKWAEFAVSVLGTVNETEIKQLYPESSVTFDLNYIHDQKRLLMRRDLDSKLDEIKSDHKFLSSRQKNHESDVITEVKSMMDRLIDAVEINLCQNDICKEDDEVREEVHTVQTTSINKEKSKRRYCELDRLDVTVIRLNENDSSNRDKLICKNSYCALGCICDSLQASVKLRGHCGRIDCMFGCKCDFSKYAMVDALNSGCSELLPGLFNLNNEINCSLSKEEQKFHQTVIVTGDKSILLKSKKRTCKSAKKYEDYYKTVDLKSKSKLKPVLTIIVPQLNCENIEPLCMVHNLYKCFCKGKFTELSVDNLLHDTNKKVDEVVDDYIILDDDLSSNEDYEKQRKEEDDNTYRARLRPHYSTSKLNYQHVYSEYETNSCARIKEYTGRKFSDDYYLSTNCKIVEMETNDANLRQRLENLISKSTDTLLYSSKSNITNSDKFNNTEKKLQSVETQRQTNKIQATVSDSTKFTSKIVMIDASSSEKPLQNSPKLKKWLETSYKQYKLRQDIGQTKNSLEPPKKGKIKLYPWEFILSRYSERKNLFLVSKVTPYRIFMAVNRKDPFLEKCTNIDDIRFAELHKYPTTVKNLLTNTNESQDFFSILFGLKNCWEIIGTVSKLGEKKDSDSENEAPISAEKDQHVADISTNLLVDLDTKASPTISTAIQEMSPTVEYPPKQSRWFIMTVENDFSEIQFYNRGFFVEYKRIIKAIHFARVSGKTIRLSSQSCVDKKGILSQFGLYAVPNTNEYCIFIGPYEINEPLGIEVVKSISLVGKSNKTRGVWITTDEVDNIKVIENPLSLIPSQRSEYKDLIPLENHGLTNDNLKTDNKSSVKETHIETSPTNDNRIVKPIKISKSNGFYHLQPRTLKSVSTLKPDSKKRITTCNRIILKPTKTSTSSSAITPIVLTELKGQHILPMTCAGGAIVNRVENKPVAEVLPQIKIASVYSEVGKEINVNKANKVDKERKVDKDNEFDNKKEFDQEKKVDKEKEVEKRVDKGKNVDAVENVDNEKKGDKVKKEGGMVILKPEEINQRLIIDGNKSPKASSSNVANGEEEMNMDIEFFLGASHISISPEHETYVISDDDEDGATNVEVDDIKEIYLECTNVKNIGALVGKQHKTKGIQFELPDSNMSDFYPPDEVFSKINQVMSRSVYIPEDLELEWRIVDSFSELESQKLMDVDSFGPKMMLTKMGFRQKRKTKSKNYNNIKIYRKKKRTMTSKEDPEGGIGNDDQIPTSSNKLENVAVVVSVESLQLETVNKEDDFGNSNLEVLDTNNEESED